MASSIRIGDYLIETLRAHGVGHVFGIPGDYVLTFNDLLEKSPLQFVTTCDEQGAGYAADAYARARGLGVVCITYCVGGLKICNTTAEAYAEKSPVVVISGAPGLAERERNPLLHHKVRDFDTQRRVFEQLTVASTVLDDPERAAAEIDRVIHAALHHKRPVYIELPRDMVLAEVLPYHAPKHRVSPRDDRSLHEALREATAMIRAARQPVILADAEVHRFGLQDELLRLATQTNIPVAATILGKSVIGEAQDVFMGIYEGAMGREDVRSYVESSDCLIMLGVLLSDINLGLNTARIDPGRSIYVTGEKLAIRYHCYENVDFRAFLDGLLQAGLPQRPADSWPRPPAVKPFVSEPERDICVQRLFQRLNAFIDAHTIVVADVGDCLFAATDLLIPHRTEFLSPAYYTSMGFAVPGAIGAQLALPDRRPLVLVGDGAFQMTGMELSTAVKLGQSPVVVILNNGGYGTERPMQDGPFNDILVWRYHRLPEVLGRGLGFDVRTEGDLEEALAAAVTHRDGPVILDVHLARDDFSPGLKRLSAGIRAVMDAGNQHAT